MFEFLLASQNLPFTIALGLMVALTVIEVATLLLGFGASELLDSSLPDMPAADVELDVDLTSGAIDLGDAASHGQVTKLLGWMHIGRVPVLILLGLFLLAFGILGLLIQSIVLSLADWMLPAVLASLPAFVGALFAVHHLGQLVARVIPRDESEVVSADSFVGRVGEIILGTARRGSPAQAKIRDRHGKTHYVMVEPDSDDSAFASGSHVLLVRRQDGLFLAIENPSDALVDRRDDSS